MTKNERVRKQALRSATKVAEEEDDEETELEGC